MPGRDAHESPLTIRATHDGLYLVAVKGATASDVYTVTAYTADGRHIGQRTFHAATVVGLPNVHGSVVFHVTGPQLNVSRKLVGR